MATPKNADPTRSLIRSTALKSRGDSIFRLVPAAFVSVGVHIGLVLALVFLLDAPDAKATMEAAAAAKSAASRNLNKAPDRKAQTPEEKKKLNLDKLDSTIVNPMAKDPDFDPIAKSRDIKAEKVVLENNIAKPFDPAVKTDGTKEISISTMPKTYGVPMPAKIGSLDSGLPGGPQMEPGLKGLPKGTDLGELNVTAGGNYGRTDANTREALLKQGGGSPESEVAVNLGLKFLKRMQLKNGSWKMDDDAYSDNLGKGQANDLAATAFGMLPFLGRGITLETTIGGEKNIYADVVQNAFNYLKSKQQKDGSLGAGYTHALCTLALTELYSMVKDPTLKKSIEPVAKKAVKYLIDSQSADGGWRYGYKDPQGDLSISGWAIMALKSADMGGLEVPKGVMDKAARYVEGVCDTSKQGYQYVPDQGATPRMSAVGLLCRQYLDGWNAANIRLLTGVENYILKIETEGDKAKAKFVVHPDAVRDIYYFYYATQVLHHFGEDHWPVWNEAMRDHLLKTQYKETKPGQEKMEGSWHPNGDPYGDAGGRLMYTSLALLTLEVYYRHLPLYYKDMVSGAK
jgi:hypothetical protein